jgi:hypothetical protein
MGAADLIACSTSKEKIIFGVVVFMMNIITLDENNKYRVILSKIMRLT